MKTSRSPRQLSRRNSQNMAPIDESSEISVVPEYAMIGSPMCHKLKTSNMPSNNARDVGRRVEIIGTLEEEQSVELMAQRYPEISTVIMKDHVANLHLLCAEASANSFRESKNYEKFSEYSNTNRKMADIRYENSYKRKEKNDTSMRRANKITYY